MKVVLNAVAAKMGGAPNYIRHVARELAASGAGEFIFILPTELAEELRPKHPRLRFIGSDAGKGSLLRRMWFDQVEVRRLLRAEKADVLYSTANFAMFACPCRQVLLVRNPLYFSPLYDEKILPRKDWWTRTQIRLRRWLNCRSITVSDVVMTPTAAMLEDVRRLVAVPPSKGAANLYGVDPGRFTPIPQRPLASPYRLVYSSLYGEHKNVETLLRAMLVLAEKKIDFLLVTPADPNSEDQQWAYTAKADAQLAADPRLRGHLQFQPNVPNAKMPELYANADVFVYPAVIESFGHPLVEAMCAGLPIVSADVPLNRELAGDAALYFSPFDPGDFAAQIQRVLDDEALRASLQNRARERSRLFRWPTHVNRLLDAFAGERERFAVESKATVS